MAEEEVDRVEADKRVADRKAADMRVVGNTVDKLLWCKW